MAADRSLQFDIEAIDKAGKAFESVALRLDKLTAKLDRLDHKRVNVNVNADTKGAEANLKRFESSLNKAGSDLPAWLDPKMVAAAAGAFVVAMPVVGAAAAAAFTLAFGAGLAGVGVLLASKNKGVQKTYEKLGDHLSKVFGKAANPFEHALQAIAPIIDKLGSKLAPVFRQIGKIVGPALVGFAGDLSRAFSNPQFLAGVKEMGRAFASVLRQLGPKLPGLFASMGSALADLGDTVSKNSDLIASMVGFLFKVVTVVLRIVDGFTIMYAWVVRNVPNIAAIFLEVFDQIAKAALLAFAWIPGLGPKLESAQQKLHSWVTKTAADLRNLPKVHEVKANITDLQSKLRTAKAELHDPTLTRAQRKRIQGDIRDLQHKLAVAKANLFALTHKSYTVTVTGNVYYTRPKGFIGPVIPHRAAGGPVMGGRSYLVGEKGPELFTPQSSGRITSNDKLPAGPVEVHVYIGDQELRGMVRTEVKASDTAKRQRTLAGTGRQR